MNEIADLPDGVLEDPVGRRIGHHDRAKPVRVRRHLGLEIIEIDVAAVAADRHHLVSRHHRTGGIGAMGRSRDEADVPLGVATLLVPRTNHHQPRVLPLRTRVGLQRDRVESGQFGEPLLELIHQFRVPLHLIQRRKGMDASELGPGHSGHLGGAVELHGA